MGMSKNLKFVLPPTWALMEVKLKKRAKYKTVFFNVSITAFKVWYCVKIALFYFPQISWIQAESRCKNLRNSATSEGHGLLYSRSNLAYLSNKLFWPNFSN